MNLLLCILTYQLDIKQLPTLEEALEGKLHLTGRVASNKTVTEDLLVAS
jgi:hypothetical protein